MADPVVVVPPVVVDVPWHQGIADAETVGHWQNKGWDVTDPKKIAVEASKAYREAEKLIGVPTAQVLRLPVDPAKDPDGMKAVWQRLGAPSDAKEYDLPAFKDKDGKVVNAALDDAIRGALFRMNVPKQMAGELASAIAKHNIDVETAKASETAAALKTEQEALAKNWGANAPANKVIAQNAAAALGMTPAEVDALEKTIGYARTMETLRNIGTKIGEDKFIRPPGPNGGTGIATREQAQARITELKSDKAWNTRYLDGDKAALREMTDLTKLVVGDDIEGRF